MQTSLVSVSHSGTAVRLTMSARVANDLGALQKGLKSLAERLGHPSCATGCDILHLAMEQEFTIGNDAALNPQPLPPRQLSVGLPQDPVPMRAVTVAIPEKVNSDINALTQAVATVMGKLGCGQCCSGFDILFRREMDLIVLDEKLNARGFGRYH